MTLRPVFEIDSNAADKANGKCLFTNQHGSEIGSEMSDHAAVEPKKRDPFRGFRAVIISNNLRKG